VGGVVYYERGRPLAPASADDDYRGTSLISNSPPPEGHHRALGIVLV